jgi:hypothetical protein
MALEDAGILAKCLRDLPELNDALTMYERMRRERAAKIYALGKQGDSGKHMVRPMQQRIRDLMMPIVFRFFATPRSVDWVYTYRVNWDAKCCISKVSGPIEPHCHPEPAKDPQLLRCEREDGSFVPQDDKYAQGSKLTGRTTSTTLSH